MQNTKQFLSDELVARIEQTDPVTADVSQFECDGLNSAEIAEWVGAQDETVVLDLSKANEAQVDRFKAANDLLPEGEKMNLLYEGDDDIARDITQETLLSEQGRKAFLYFVRKVVKEFPDLLKTDFNCFAADDEHNGDATSIRDLHFIRNLGIEGDDEMIDRLFEMFDEVICQPAIEGAKTDTSESIRDVYTRDLLPGFKDYAPQISSARDKIFANLEGLASCANRGPWYSVKNPDKLLGANVYQLRVLAVSAYLEWMEKNPV
jgi:hypothetical protein